VIHLDTNALVALPRWIRDGHPLIHNVEAGEPVAASSVAWYEYVTGPVDEAEVARAAAFIEHRIVPLDAEHAQLAAELFNGCGRKRTLKFDALIAATAIQTAAAFLTLNVRDFAPFVSRGLKLFTA
jgi:predicted nucleic acid-binding protein